MPINLNFLRPSCILGAQPLQFDHNIFIALLWHHNKIAGIAIKVKQHHLKLDAKKPNPRGKNSFKEVTAFNNIFIKHKDTFINFYRL